MLLKLNYKEDCKLLIVYWLKHQWWDMTLDIHWKIQTILLFGKPNLVIFIIQANLWLIHLLHVLKKNGWDRAAWLCYYHMDTMELDQNTQVVAWKDGYNKEFKIKTFNLYFHLLQVQYFICWEDKCIDNLENHWLLQVLNHVYSQLIIVLRAK